MGETIGSWSEHKTSPRMAIKQVVQMIFGDDDIVSQMTFGDDHTMWHKGYLVRIIQAGTKDSVYSVIYPHRAPNPLPPASHLLYIVAYA